MKILYLSPGAALGGAERSLLDVIASVRDAAPDSDLHLVVTGEGPLNDDAQRLGVQVTVLPMPPALATFGESALIGSRSSTATLSLLIRVPSLALATLRYASQLHNVVTRISPQIVHSNGIKFHLLTRLAKLRSFNVIWHIRDFLGERPMMRRGLGWAESSATSAIAISNSVAADARQFLPRLPIHMIYNAVDTEYFSPGTAKGKELDALGGVPPHAPENVVRVGLAATFARWKGQDVFLEAARLLQDSRPDLPLRFFLIGGPIYGTRGSEFSEEELRSLANKLNVAHLFFVKFQQEMADIYRSLDIVVHASKRPEPFGRTIVEAMSCGKAVIVSRAGGAAELFTHNHDAIGVPPAIASELAASITRLAENKSEVLRLGDNARRTAVDQFDRARLGREILSIYEKTLSQVKDCPNL